MALLYCTARRCPTVALLLFLFFTMFSEARIELTADTIQWNLGTKQSSFNHRGHSKGVGTTDGTKAFVMGGIDGGLTRDLNSVVGWGNDVWTTTDGISWSETTSRAQWRVREVGAVVAYGSRVVLLGGGTTNGVVYNDGWSTTDGVTWALLTYQSKWSIRHKTSVSELGGKWYLLGGQLSGTGCMNDAWSTTDMVEWTLVTAQADWSSRVAPSVVLHDKVYIVGGGHTPTSTAHNDVWSSVDGISWQLRTSRAWFAARFGASLSQMGRRLWLFGGSPASQPGAVAFNDIFHCNDDGINWIPLTSLAPWTARTVTSVITLDKALIPISGAAIDNTVVNDIWRGLLPQCPAFTAPAHSTVTPTSVLSAPMTIDEIATVSCDPGWLLAGNATLICGFGFTHTTGAMSTQAVCNHVPELRVLSRPLLEWNRNTTVSFMAPLCCPYSTTKNFTIVSRSDTSIRVDKHWFELGPSIAVATVTLFHEGSANSVILDVKEVNGVMLQEVPARALSSDTMGCNGRGLCSGLYGAAERFCRCDCDTGWTGPFCETQVATCSTTLP